MAEDKKGDLYPDDDPEEFDLQDQSKILFGAQAISGKALLAGRADAQITEDIDRRKLAQREQASAEEARELASLANWNKQYTSVGGVKMTNEEAQNARQKFIDNEDEFADQAAEAGLIQPGQKDALKGWMRRKHELEDRKGRGVITKDEERELKAGDQSAIGQAADKVTADIFQGKAFGLDAKAASGMNERAVERTHSDVGYESSFQHTPPVKAEFLARAEPVQPAAVPTPPTAPARKVEATGLDL
ncbi:MAG TPA: hypothetical protein VGN52_11310 [Burkholderiales bacterium]